MAAFYKVFKNRFQRAKDNANQKRKQSKYVIVVSKGMKYKYKILLGGQGGYSEWNKMRKNKKC